MKKLNLHKARRVLINNDELSMKELEWEIPERLVNSIERRDYFETFVSLGEWKNSKEKYIFLTVEGKYIYLEKEIIKSMWEAVK